MQEINELEVLERRKQQSEEMVNAGWRSSRSLKLRHPLQMRHHHLIP